MTATIYAFPLTPARGREANLVRQLERLIATGSNLGSRDAQIETLVCEIDRMSGLAYEQIEALARRLPHADYCAVHHLAVESKQLVDSLRAMVAALNQHPDRYRITAPAGTAATSGTQDGTVLAGDNGHRATGQGSSPVCSMSMPTAPPTHIVAYRNNRANQASSSAQDPDLFSAS